VHVFVGHQPHQSIADLLQDIKGDSSRWINQRRFVSGRFRWQAGYGAFSYSRLHIDRVARYIERQEEHHRIRPFRDEYVGLLEEFGIAFDERYILQDVE